MKKIVRIVGLLIMLCALGAVYAGYLLFSSPYQLSETSFIYVDADDSMDSLMAKVQDAAHAKSMDGFRFMSTFKRFKTPRTGKYAIEPGVSSYDLVRSLANGHQIPVKLVVPNVRTVDNLVERIAESLMISADDIHAVLHSDEVMGDMGYTEASLLCLFIPNTYEVYWNISAKQLINRLQREKEAFWNKERLAKAESIGFTPEEVTTIASIVESETSYGPEKATVAGLYIHRLEIGMLLQSDPTVIFAIGDFGIRRVSLEQTRYDSPYNTYVYKGLPPGPIRIPTVAGIDAVLNYDHNSYLYMCAKEDFSGSHNFTSSYAEHLQNARRYQQALNARGIKK